MQLESQKIRSAEQRFPEIFLVIDAIIGYFSNVVDKGRLSMPAGHLGLVRVSAVMRAYNLLKSIRQLLATDHWENAAILMRCLFELVLNMEEVERDKDQAEEQAERFVRFETLQRYRRLKANSEYELRTRGTAHDSRLIEVEKKLPNFFGEWIEKRKQDGTIKWKTSWCGKQVRQLCEASKALVRIGQYEIVYSYSSDIAHSSPHGVLSTHKCGNSADWETAFANIERSERNEALLVMSLSVTFACEVVGIVGFLEGTFKPIEMLRLTRSLFDLQGVKPPALHPKVEAAMRAATGTDTSQ